MEEILHHQKDGWNPINSGKNHRFQLVQDFWFIHSILIVAKESGFGPATDLEDPHPTASGWWRTMVFDREASTNGDCLPEKMWFDGI